MKTVHLKNDLDINKALVKKQVNELCSYLSKDEIVERELDSLQELLNRRTQVYNLEEAKDIVCMYTSSSDLCVLDNHWDYSPLEVYRANEKYNRQCDAMDIIESLTDEA